MPEQRNRPGVSNSMSPSSAGGLSDVAARFRLSGDRGARPLAAAPPPVPCRPTSVGPLSCARTSWAAPPPSTNMDQIRLATVEFRSNVARRPNLAWNRPSLARHRPASGKLRPELTNFSPNSTNIDQIWPELDLSSVARNRPRFGQNANNLGQLWPGIDQLSPDFD